MNDVRKRPAQWSPIAVGGLGGSGTRVFASALQALGVYIGEDLNTPLDNLWFTVLFKREEWISKYPSSAEIRQAVRLFSRAMTDGLAGNIAEQERQTLAKIERSMPPLGDWRPGAGVSSLQSLLASLPSRSAWWGWKEPNTHIFLKELDAAIPNFRYIHVVRDALDMAFSGNTWQMRHWGHQYGIEGDAAVPLPVRQLRYWIKANQRVIDYGFTAMGDRFLVISYEDFCLNSERYLKPITEIVGAKTVACWPKDLIVPTTIGRSQHYDCSIFDEADLIKAESIMAKINY